MADRTAGELLVALLRAIERADYAEIGDLFDPHGAFECPYSPGGQMAVHGREDVVALLRGSMETMLKTVTFTIDREYPCTDPAFAIAEYRSDALLHNGKTYANRYITVCEVRDGRIVLFREHFDPQAIVASMS
ncbi:MAG TPA: nuclear transport factor 2 family protein [Novosphingobium sp.]|nr:nuclear transport factor 2 family protein [Novosphingobium sp.]